MGPLIRRGRAAALALVVLAGATSSCGLREERLDESGATLEGSITFGGEPVQFAMVMVQTANGSASGRVGEDGRYKVENVPLGEVRIGVNTAAAQGEFQSAVMKAGAYKGPDAKGRGRVNLKFIQVPSQFFNPDTSDIKTTIVKGTNTFDIVVPK